MSSSRKNGWKMDVELVGEAVVVGEDQKLEVLGWEDEELVEGLVEVLVEELEVEQEEEEVLEVVEVEELGVVQEKVEGLEQEEVLVEVLGVE